VARHDSSSDYQTANLIKKSGHSKCKPPHLQEGGFSLAIGNWQLAMSNSGRLDTRYWILDTGCWMAGSMFYHIRFFYGTTDHFLAKCFQINNGDVFYETEYSV
jgi:hypothetical protein